MRKDSRYCIIGSIDNLETLKGLVMKMIEWKENEIDVDTYLYLRESVGWKKLSREQAQKALDHSLFTLCAYLDGKPVGMGRIVGDGAVICYVQDLIRHPDARGHRIGKMILERLIAYVESLRLDGTEMMLDLMCAKGRESFYQSFGFIARPTDHLGPGMIMYQNDEERKTE